MIAYHGSPKLFNEFSMDDKYHKMNSYGFGTYFASSFDGAVSWMDDDFDGYIYQVVIPDEPYIGLYEQLPFGVCKSIAVNISHGLGITDENFIQKVINLGLESYNKISYGVSKLLGDYSKTLFIQKIVASTLRNFGVIGVRQGSVIVVSDVKDIKITKVVGVSIRDGEVINEKPVLSENRIREVIKETIIRFLKN